MQHNYPTEQMISQKDSVEELIDAILDKYRLEIVNCGPGVLCCVESR